MMSIRLTRQVKYWKPISKKSTFTSWIARRLPFNVSTPLQSPLYIIAGFPIDAVLLTRNNDVVLVPRLSPVTVPWLYHLLSQCSGWQCQSLANSEDPRYLSKTATFRDPRVPIYDIKSPILRAVREENWSQVWTQQPDHMM
jgi:hypothetical protein